MMARNLRLTDELVASHQLWKNREAAREIADVKSIGKPCAANEQQQAGETGTRVAHNHETPRSTRGPATPTVVGLCRAAGLPIPVTEHAFHPGRRWRFDYAWPQIKLALEIEGGLWKSGGGAHSHPSNIERDIEKYSEAAILGWRILRATTDELRNNVALDRIARAFRVAA